MTTPPPPPPPGLLQDPPASLPLPPDSSRSVVEATMEWADSLVGRDWEVYWKPDDTSRTCSPITCNNSITLEQRQDDQPITNEAILEAFTEAPGSNDATLTVTETNGINDEILNDSSTRDAEAIEGFDNNEDEMDVENDDDNNDEEEESVLHHEADWYDATIVSNQEQQLRGGSFCFKVSFVGDDSIYEMELSPADVRPSAKAWMQRTKKILQEQPSAGSEKPTITIRSNDCTKNNGRDNLIVSSSVWIANLPPDTSTLADQEAIRSIQSSVTTREYVLLPDLSIGNENHGDDASLVLSDASLLPSCGSLEAIQRLVVLVRTQIMLRRQLAPIVHNNSSSGGGGGADGQQQPREQDLDHLVDCLQELEQCCAWYYTCWRLHSVLLGSKSSASSSSSSLNNDKNDNPPSPLPKEEERFTMEFLLKDCLDVGRKTLISLVPMDLSPVGLKRRRAQTPAASSEPTTSTVLSPTRRTKRRKKQMKFDWNNSTSTTANDDDGDGDTTTSFSSFIQQFSEEDFFSADVVNMVAGRIRGSDTRWYCVQLATMLQSVSTNIADPFLSWRRRTEYILSDNNDDNTRKADAVVDAPMSDSGRSSEQEEVDSVGDNVDEEERHSSSGQRRKRSKRYVTYEEIESAIRSAKQDGVLKHLELSDFIARLQHKLSDIEKFARQAWDTIGVVLDDNNAGDGDSSEPSLDRDMPDQTMQKLKQLLETIDSKASTVANVEPLGRATSPLTRKVIESAIQYRSWFLCLKRAETIRERALFIEKVVAGFDELPPLPAAPDGADSIAVKIATVAPRVKALSDKYASYSDSVIRYTRMVENPALQELEEIATVEGVSAALDVLGKVPFISIAEEMLSIRKDVFEWISEAQLALASARPAFSELVTIKKKADLLLEGKSPTRLTLLHDLEDNGDANGSVRDFAKSEMSELCGSLHTKMDSMHAGASAWKDRSDSIVTALRLFGNPIAGEQLTNSRVQTAMVDLKRVSDLLNDYGSLGVSLECLFDILTRVHTESVEWSSTMTEYLLDDNNDFEGCLSLVRENSRHRPKGIIVDPTRQVVDLLDELLSWYMAVKRIAGSINAAETDVDQPLLEGFEILERFSQNRSTTEQFTVSLAQATLLLSTRLSSRGAVRVLSVTKLETSPLCNAVLCRLVDNDRDSQEGYPLLSLLHYLWLIVVEDFTTRSLSGTSQEGDLSLAGANGLLASRPLPSINDTNEGQNLPFFRTGGDYEVLGKLEGLAREAEQKQTEAQAAVSHSRYLLRDSLDKPDDVHQHLLALKEHLVEFKSRSGEGKGLILDRILEQQLEHDVKLFTWLDKAYQYRVLRTREIDDDFDLDEQVPWDVLIGLRDRIPQSDTGGGDFAYAVLRVKELHESASAWQQEISSLTMLSLRGGKKRATPIKTGEPGPNPADDDDESSIQIDLKKVAELSNDPILWKVAMPREQAIRQMLENTQKFEVLLYDLLGNDYDGVNSDRAAYPEPGSLVSVDGSFVLYRLTGSPLFETLKTAIATISETASDVFAETPGKATFDWIRQAVSWIETLSESVTRLPLSQGQEGGRLILPNTEARKLLSVGEKILLNVPDDLRKTLGKHKIFVSTTKDGKLTVKSKKGGAHHAVGVTAIRWCPLLFDSLKADCARLDSWQASVMEVAAAFTAYMQQQPSTEEEFLLRFHSFEDEVSDLLWQLQDLVVYPASNIIDSTKRLLAGIHTRLQTSASDIAAKYATSKYQDPAAVVGNRFLLLDALKHRRSKDPEAEMPSLGDGPSKEGPFRNALRALIEKALRKVMSLIDISPDSEEASALCAMKAWEIEYNLFDHFQGDLGESQISSEYRERARALKRSLEDNGNTAFCVRVLTGGIEAEALVRMSTEDLANPKTKEDRAKAAAVAKQSVVLTGTTGEIPKKPVEPGRINSEKTVHSRNAAISLAAETAKEEKPAARAGKDGKVAEGTATTSVLTPPTSGRGIRSSPSFSLGDVVKNARKNRGPPPPPPSLAASLRSPQVPSTPQSSGNLVCNSSGGDHFIVTIGSRKFSAGLYSETGDPNGLTDGLLPEELVEKGRLRIDEFTKFLRTKLEGGRWAALSLRLATFSDKHAREYKKFYKDYESRQRIVMVPLQHDAKVFLVTPKFHRSATGLDFEDASSTYAVVLTRK